MELSQAALFAAGGSIIAFWGQAKAFVARIFSFIIRNDKIESANTSELVIKEILKDSKIIRWGSRTFCTSSTYIYKYDGYFRAVYSYLPSLFIIYNKKFPIFISEREDGISITYIPGTIDIQKVLLKIHDKSLFDRLNELKEKPNYFGIIEISGNDEVRTQLDSTNDKDGSIAKSASVGSKIFKNIFTLEGHNEFFGFSAKEIFAPPNQKVENHQYFWSKEALKLDGEVSFWLNARSWYQERKISWRRGAMLTGKPGTGKTKMVEAVARKNGLHIRKLNISNMSNSEFTKAFNTGGYEYAVVLIEDIDAVFNKRENILAKSTHQKQLVSFDTVINAIGGLKGSDGVFLIITSNHPEVLDEALIRCGRIDAKIEVGPLCEGGRRFIAENILNGYQNLIDTSVNECNGMVAAEFENHCIELAIKEKNKEYE